MSKGYVIFTEKITNQQALDAYAAAAVPTVIAAGGTAIIAGPPTQVAEGDWHGDITVVLEFDTLDAARSWYHSADYQTVASQRHDAATSNVAIFEGFDPPAAPPLDGAASQT